MSGCMCVYLDVFPGVSAQGICPEGVSGGVSPKGWCLSGGVRVSSGGVGGCLPGRCLCLDGGFCTGEVSGQRHVFPKGGLSSAGVFLGAVCVDLPLGGLPRGVSSGECLLRKIQTCRGVGICSGDVCVSTCLPGAVCPRSVLWWGCLPGGLPRGYLLGCLLVGWVGAGSALGCLFGGIYLWGCLPGWGVSTQVGVCPVDCMCLPDGVGSAQGVSTWGVCLAGECLPRWVFAQLAACVCLMGGSAIHLLTLPLDG